MTSRSSSLRRRGGVILEGLGYSFEELAHLEPLPRHACGLPGLDEHGIHPGAVWTLAVPHAMGASTFAIQVAVAASLTGKVLLINGHVATHLLQDRVKAELEVAGDNARAAHIDLASGMGFPRVGERLGDAWVGSEYDVIVIDTLDENFLPESWPTSVQEQLKLMRWLRWLARENDTAMVLTARVPPPRTGGQDAFLDEWCRHWARAPFADVSDVRIEMWETEHLGHPLRAYRRGAGWWLGRAYVRPPKYRMKFVEGWEEPP